jgi:hypothetical protein
MSSTASGLTTADDTASADAFADGSEYNADDPPLPRSIFEDDYIEIETTVDGKTCWRCLWCNTTFPGKNATKALAHLTGGIPRVNAATCRAAIRKESGKIYKRFLLNHHNKKKGLGLGLALGYITPSRKEIGDGLLQLKYNARQKSIVSKLRFDKEIFGLTLFGNGATVHKMPFINMLGCGVYLPLGVLEITAFGEARREYRFC